MEYEAVIGLEIHVELSTESKMFCGCRVEFGGEPNTRTCPVCLAHPGALPVINGEAIRSIARIGLALDCSIPGKSIFHRKNYFYPDLPKGYQISQYDQPFAVEGYLYVTLEDETFRVVIERVHQEEDTAKNIHAGESGRTPAHVFHDRFQPPGHPGRDCHRRKSIHPRSGRLTSSRTRCLLERIRLQHGRRVAALRRNTIRPAGDRLGKTELKNMNSFKSYREGTRTSQTDRTACAETGRPADGALRRRAARSAP